MLRKILQGLLIFLFLLLLLALFTITTVDRNPYKETAFYSEMDTRLDSLDANWVSTRADDTLRIGWSKVSITPEVTLPLAGYGARRPKEMTGVHDSAFVRVVVLRQGAQKVAFFMADLLIVHPEVKNAIFRTLPKDWSSQELFFTATHTHSGLGGWAPGLVGKLFSGSYDPAVVAELSERFVEALQEAEEKTSPGLIGCSPASLSDLVYNRLVKEKGIVDPWLKVFQMANEQGIGLITSFSAHATCLGRKNRTLSGDFPSALVKQLESDISVDFAGYAAGAVASMGPHAPNMDDWAQVSHLASGIERQIEMLRMIGVPFQSTDAIRSFHLKLPTRDPYFKISESLALRPYLFKSVFGDYQPKVSVLQLGKLLVLGMPCDFSGELAVPLYEYARERGLELMITSFNGDYLGYVIKDQWYDLEKYEARTMSWYGADIGTYLTEVSKRIIDAAPTH